jgi:tRNA uracil 4-sulfurtransferase
MIVIIRYGEISLKGKNRSYFENKLVSNIRKQVEGKVWKTWNRIYADIENEDLKKLSRIFGIVSYSPCVEAELSYEDIQDKIMNLGLDGYDNNTRFRVSCQRLQKNLESSKEVERKIGSFVNVNFGFKVDLVNFDLNIAIEIADKAHIYKDKFPGLGGLPVGVAGKVACLIEDKSSLLASFLAMKRGCRIFPVGENFECLEKYSPFQLKNNKLEDLEIEAICVNDTLDNLRDNFEILTLRPLVGMNSEEINKRLEII